MAISLDLLSADALDICRSLARGGRLESDRMGVFVHTPHFSKGRPHTLPESVARELTDRYLISRAGTNPATHETVWRLTHKGQMAAAR